MARLVALFLLISCTSFAQLVDRIQPAPQTPRQALIEILKSKDASSVERHLPEITKKKLREFSTDQTAGLAAVMGGHFPGPIGHGAGEGMEVFEAGPVLARFQEERTHENLEIVIESEDFRGDESHLELGFHMYKAGEEVTRWYAPRLLLHMKEEGGIWRVAEVAFTAKLPLGNPDFLDAMGKDFRKKRNQAVLGNLRAVLSAQIMYSENYPGVGYACSLASLGSGQREASKREIGPLHGSLIDNALAAGRKDGYIYAISACTGRPATNFTVTAAPEARASGSHAYCSNESGVIRYSADGRVETCLANGKALE